MKHWRVILVTVCLLANVRCASLVNAEAAQKRQRCKREPYLADLQCGSEWSAPDGAVNCRDGIQAHPIHGDCFGAERRNAVAVHLAFGLLNHQPDAGCCRQPDRLDRGTYNGTVSIASGGATQNVTVTLVLSTSTSGGGTGTGGYKLIGWNDLGMHCFDGADYSVFGVLPPYNTIHAQLIDPSGNLIVSPTGYTLTYQAVSDPLTHTLNTTSIGKTNFWDYANFLGFPNLLPDEGLAGFRMPGSGNVPQSMTFSTSDNTWVATGIPITPFADSTTGTYGRNYFPMMRLVAKNSSGTVLATQDIVLPTSDEMTCSTCHSSTSGYTAAEPAGGWVNASDPAQDTKLNILRKHDDRWAGSTLFKAAAQAAGYSTSGLVETVNTMGPVFCDNCHASNALSKPGYPGVPALTTSMHSLHAGVIDPATGQTMEAGTTRSTCYNCHPGPKTQCLRGVMANLTTSTGAKLLECQNCHGPMSYLASTTRQGWLDEPSCQTCHTGTATSNAGQIVYTSAFSSGSTFRTTLDATFATNPDTPSSGLSLYRFSEGHGGLQCEGCHGSTHAIFDTSIVNDNVMSTNLQGHTGTLAECTACHASTPNTITGGPQDYTPSGHPGSITMKMRLRKTCPPARRVMGRTTWGPFCRKPWPTARWQGKHFPRAR